MDNASRCPQSHNLIIFTGEGFALFNEVKDRAERQRRNWIRAYLGLAMPVQYVAGSASHGRPFASGCVDMSWKGKWASGHEPVAPVILRR